MDRKRILSEIRRQLQEPLAEHGQARPLGEIVGSIAQATRAVSDKETGQVAVPVWQVAAFVDGTLSPAEESFVVDAILADNSVLAEVVASLRSQQTAVPHTELPADHQHRLLQMIQSQRPAELTSLTAEAQLRNEPEFEQEPQEELASPSLVQAVALSPGSELSKRESQTHSRVHRRSTEHERNSAWPVVTLATAAAIVLILGTVALVVSNLQTAEQFVQDEESNGAGERSPEDRGLAVTERSPKLPPQIEDESPAPPSSLTQAQAGTPEGRAPAGDSGQALDSAPVSPPPTNSVAVENGLEDMPSKMPRVPNSPPARLAPSPAGLLIGLRWKTIDGLVVQGDSSEASETSNFESSGNLPVWNQLRPQDLVWESVSAKQPSRIRTLPLSRGEIEIPNSESTIIVGPDSEMRLLADNLDSRTLNIELRHGAFAIPKTPFELRLRLRGYDRRLGVVQLSASSSITFSYSPLGLQFDLLDGSVAVNGESYEPGTHAFTRDGRIVESGQPASMPRWSTRLKKELPKRVLDSLAEEKNLSSGLAKRIQHLRSQPLNARDLGNLTVLAQLQTALAGEQAPQFLASEVGLVRLAAINRLVSIPDWDPRYRAMWATSVKATKNRRMASQLKAIAKNVREGTTLTPKQIETLVAGMEAQESASRAMSYLILKNAFPQGPPFDPNWASQLRTRSINAWRKNLRLPLIGSRAAAGGNANP
ncbi:MAG: hypothetical protein AB8B50_00035 [Pirellulaceae bacterium]